MQRSRGRPYRRRTRKAACKLCSARHIRCRTPESPADGTTPARGDIRATGSSTRKCRACQIANEICETIDEAIQVPTQTTHEATTSPCVEISCNAVDFDYRPAQSSPAYAPNASSSSNGPVVIPQMENPGGAATADTTTSLSDNGSSPGNRSNNNNKEGGDMLFLRLVESGEQTIVRPGNKIISFGDSNWTYIIREARRTWTGGSSDSHSSKNNTHYAIPDSIDETLHDQPDFETGYLRYKGALSLPPKIVQDALIETYFIRHHPSNQIFDRADFYQSYHSGNVSLLLLNAVLFVASIYGDEQLIRENFGSRHAAELTFFKRAKMLFNADYESNPITNIQALFLMSFWWGGPTDQKDNGHWLGAAITLAQARGMHRSTAGSSLSLKDQRLWKRIWWALYSRDRSDAAAVGRPPHIHDDDCDVEMLTESDLEESLLGPSNPPVSSRASVLYVIEQLKLFVILGRIAKPKFGRDDRNETDHELVKQVSDWEEQLPRELVYDCNNNLQRLGDRFWAALLQIEYSSCVILLHRTSYIVAGDTSNNDSPAITAANRITRIIEDILMQGVIRAVPVYLVPCIFSTLTIYATCMRRSQGLHFKLARQKARLCLLALSELKDLWPFAGWILRLFERIMLQLSENSTPAEQKEPSNTESTSSNTQKPGGHTASSSELVVAHAADADQSLHSDVFPFGPAMENMNSFGFVEPPFWNDFALPYMSTVSEMGQATEGWQVPSLDLSHDL